MNLIRKPLALVEGAGGCSCCRTGTLSTAATAKDAALNIQTFRVSGMTCGHCVGVVSAELEEIAGVTGVSVALLAGGTSMVTVTSDRLVSEPEVAAALREAGNYQLAPANQSDSPLPGGNRKASL